MPISAKSFVISYLLRMTTPSKFRSTPSKFRSTRRNFVLQVLYNQLFTTYNDPVEISFYAVEISIERPSGCTVARDIGGRASPPPTVKAIYGVRSTDTMAARAMVSRPTASIHTLSS